MGFWGPLYSATQRDLVRHLSLICLLVCSFNVYAAAELLDRAHENHNERGQALVSYSLTRVFAGGEVQQHFQKARIGSGANQRTGFVPIPERGLSSEILTLSGDPSESGTLPAGVLGEELTELLSNYGVAPQVFVRLASYDPAWPHVVGLEARLNNHVARGARSETSEGEVQLIAELLHVPVDREGGSFHVNKVQVWLDPETLTSRRVVIGALLKRGEEAHHEMTLETDFGDWVSFNGSDLLLPVGQRTRVEVVPSGDAKDAIRATKARLDYAELEMSSMSRSQSQMMREVFGAQLDAWRDQVSEHYGIMDALNRAERAEQGLAASTPATMPAEVQPTPPPPADRAQADPVLVGMIHDSLTRLDYDLPENSGVVTTELVVAISAFQAKNGLEVTGEVTPQIAGRLAAHLESIDEGVEQAPSTAVEDSAAVAENQATTLEARRMAAERACIEARLEKQAQRQQRRQGIGRIIGAIGRTSGEFGGDVGLSEGTQQVLSAASTANELSLAAKELGLGQSEIEQCRREAQKVE